MPNESTIFRVCSFLRNWFDSNETPYYGTITISNGSLIGTYNIHAGQYFRIVNSHRNDGVYLYPCTMLKDESFDGAICGMSIPAPVLAIMDKIEAWEAKYSGVDSVNMSPYTSESMAGSYSYSKSTGGAGDTTKSKAGTWQGVFAAELQPWRKI